MTVRRLAEKQPEAFVFTAESRSIAEREIAKYPPGRQHSAVIGLLWQAQIQHGGWLPEPAIRQVADILEMPFIRALEIATFYTMFNLAPVGTTAHVQVCGTTPCMLRGAEDLKQICGERIHAEQYGLSTDSKFSWVEVECAGACVNAPIVQIGSDTFEDLTVESFNELLDDLEAGRPVTPGPQMDRQFAEPVGGGTTLAEIDPAARTSAPRATASASSASDIGGGGAAQDGGVVDLKLITGIGPKLERRLHDLGIYRFDQIAAWTAEDVARVEDQLKFKGRIQRDDWIGQCQTLMIGSSGSPKP